MSVPGVWRKWNSELPAATSCAGSGGPGGARPGRRPLAHLVPVAGPQGLGHPRVRVLRVEHVLVEVGADRDVVERDVRQGPQRVTRKLRIRHRVVLELELRGDLGQLWPVGTGSRAHAAPTWGRDSSSDHAPSKSNGPREWSEPETMNCAARSRR